MDRREIPPLESLCRPEFTPIIVARSYSYGRNSPMRVCRGEPLRVWVKVHSYSAHRIRMRFFSTLHAEDGNHPHFSDCERVGDDTFVCHFTPAHSGAYVFRANYSLDDGQTWSFDDVPYTWLIADPPSFNNIRMYTLLPTASDHIDNWKAELTRIKKLGCNMVHLLPVTLMDESESPYSAHDLFSIDHSYLNPGDPRDGLAQWEDFVEHAKSLGIKLCIDLVLNHVGAKSHIAKSKPNWIVPDLARPDGFKRAGCWTDTGWLTWEDVLLLNYSNQNDSDRDALWHYMIEYALFWASYAAHTDGMVRFDNLHSSNPDFISALTQMLRVKYPDLILLAEFFGEENTLVQRTLEWDIDLLLATPWDYKFVPELRRYLMQLHRLSPQIRFLVPISSHDSGSPTEEFWSVEASYPRYATSALLSFGATGLSQGIEWGIERKIKFIGRKRPSERRQFAELESFIQKVNQILEMHSAFKLTQNCHFVDDNHHAIIAAVRLDPHRPNECFIVAANFDVKAPHGVKVDVGNYLPSRCAIHAEELLTGRIVEGCSEPCISIQLAPCQVEVLHCRIR